MATESPIKMLESNESKKWLSSVDPTIFSSSFTSVSGPEGFKKTLNQSSVLEQNRLVPSRSGSAPPTIEGSLAAFQSLIDQRSPGLADSRSEFLDCDAEEQMRKDPAYVAYYYSKGNLNPRLPPPLISRENHHLARLMGAGGKRISVTEGLLETHKEEPEEDLSTLHTLGDQKQNDSGGYFFQAPPAYNAAVKERDGQVVETVSTAEQILNMDKPCSSSTDVHRDAHNVNCPDSFATSSPCHKSADSMDNVSIQSNAGSDISVVELRMKSLDISGGSVPDDHQNRLDNIHLHDRSMRSDHPLQNAMYQVTGHQHLPIPHGMYALHGRIEKLAAAHLTLPAMQPFIHNPGPLPPLYATTAAYMTSANFVYPGLMQPGSPSPQLALGGPSTSSGFRPAPFSGYLQNHAYPVHMDAHTMWGFSKPPVEALAGEMNPYANQMLGKHYAQHEFMQRPLCGSLRGHYFLPNFQDAQRAVVQHTLASSKDSHATSLTGLEELSHPAVRSSTNRAQINVNYYGCPPSLCIPQFPPSSLAVPGTPVSGSNYSGLTSDLTASQHSPEIPAEFLGWKGQRGPEGCDDSKRSPFMELLKSCSSKKLELSDISGKIVDFSTDQHGSRFIQQKLEHCSADEKESVFKEVLPHASKLMADVFGNYVIQKFFEYGTPEQRRKLGEQLTGQIVSLSLQMYGCRVIQKALEVIELDQKVKLIQELDGHVMKCVHDQNGNHVIQKCIESVPAENIEFIISSFYGQVEALSSHPYGCRVIQRVLEHCSDEKISQCIIDEILESTFTLAQDPYGNYVTQHILETGKTHERSQIICKLTGKFVQMSQHKYASNVVEKCLKYGDASERDRIIEEFMAQSDNNNEALLVMMKDQFANYVVQKIFDIGTEKQKETLIKCIQSHLIVLRKYTYAKQIVTRYEQLTEGSLQEQK